METNQKYQFRQQSDNESNQRFTGKQIDVLQEVPGNSIPYEITVAEPPVENPIPTTPEPGVNEPEKDDPTRIDEEPPIFNYY